MGVERGGVRPRRRRRRAPPQPPGPSAADALQRLIERLVSDPPPGLIAVLGMSPAGWPAGAIFVFDDTVSIVDAVAGRWGDAPPNLDVLFVRRSELPLLGYPTVETITPIHPDVWARQGDVLWGVDLRSEIPAIGDARMRLAINIERSSNAVRRLILACLVMSRTGMLVALLSGEIAELRQSVELMTAAGAAPPRDVDDAFEGWHKAASGRSGVQVAWHFERVLLGLRRWLDGDRSSRSRGRPPRRGELAHHDVLQPRDAIEARYQAQVAWMLDDLRPIDGRIVSILLTGSMVRHTLRPGVSDLVDGFVIVDDATFESEAAHAKLLSTFVRACRRLAAGGLPFHPFRYQSHMEFTQAALPFFNPVWRSDADSAVLAGEDLRASVRSSPAGHVWAARAFFTHALRYRRFAAFGRSGVQAADRHWLLRAVRGELKPLPVLACFACGQSVGTRDALSTLARTLDPIDLSAYDTIVSIHEHAKHEEQVPVLVERATHLVETIASRTADWVRRHREASFWRV